MRQPWHPMSLNFDLVPRTWELIILCLFSLFFLQMYEEAAQAFMEVLKLDSTCAEAAQELMRVQITQLMVCNNKWRAATNESRLIRLKEHFISSIFVKNKTSSCLLYSSLSNKYRQSHYIKTEMRNTGSVLTWNSVICFRGTVSPGSRAQTP